MNAWLLETPSNLSTSTCPLTLAVVPDPRPEAGEVCLRVRACGICHTELDEIEGRTLPAHLPRILGHQVVGHVEALGAGVDPSLRGARVGVAWIFAACGECQWCRTGRENLCPSFVATGRDVDGGFADFMVARADFVHRLPDVLGDVDAAPLLCAGAIGLRSLEATGLTDGETLGLTGFGASGHLVLAMARVRFPRSPVFVFARGAKERALAQELGAAWTGDTREDSPRRLDAIIDTTPVWTPIVRALRQLAPGGRLVINAIRKEDADKAILSTLDYPRDVWMEKVVRSVANVARADVRGCLELASHSGIRPEATTYPFARLNEALLDLKRGGAAGAKVLVLQ